MVKQLNGYYKVKDPSLKMFVQEITRLKGKLSHFEISHVPREENKEADALANRSLNNRDKGDVVQELW